MAADRFGINAALVGLSTVPLLAAGLAAALPAGQGGSEAPAPAAS
jgi:hypothetical protein